MRKVSEGSTSIAETMNGGRNEIRRNEKGEGHREIKPWREKKLKFKKYIH